MRRVKEQSTFDWSRSIDLNIKSRGMKSLWSNVGRDLPNLNVVKVSSRVEWPLQQYQNGSRYLSRRVWVS